MVSDIWVPIADATGIGAESEEIKNQRDDTDKEDDQKNNRPSASTTMGRRGVAVRIVIIIVVAVRSVIVIIGKVHLYRFLLFEGREDHLFLGICGIVHGFLRGLKKGYQ